MYRYSAYGEVEITGDATIANINHIIYKSYYYDFESGLYYLKSRYYNPSLGIFIQPDKADYLYFDNEIIGFIYNGIRYHYIKDMLGRINYSFLIKIIDLILIK